MNTTTKTQESKPEVLTLAEQIGALHRDIEGRYAEMYDLLTKAKGEAGKGFWSKWLVANREVLGFGERQARLYLRPPASRDADQRAHREAQAAHRQRRKLHVVPPRKDLEDKEAMATVVQNTTPVATVVELPVAATPLDAVEGVKLLDKLLEKIVPPSPEAEDIEDKKALPPPPGTKHPWGNEEWKELTPEEWKELTPDEQEEYRRATRVQAVLADLEGAADQITKAASELTAAERRRVTAVVKILLNVVPATVVRASEAAS
jgi:hypothetical protein